MIPRARRAGVLVSALALLVGCTGSGHEEPGPVPHGSARMRLAPGCPPPPAHPQRPTVAQVNKIGTAIDLPTWQAGDIGASGRLSDGRLVWLFGDTTRPTLTPPIVANSMLVTSGRCVSQLLGPDKGPVVPDMSQNVVRWPMSVAVGRQHGHDVVLVLCSRIDRGNSGSFGFTFLGTSAAVFDVRPGQAPQLDKVVDITPNSRKKTQVNWGAAATVHGDWIYVYGTRLTGRAYDFGRELYLARTPVADPGNRKRWQVWDGSGWASKPSRAVAVLPSRGGVSQTLSVDSIGDRWVAVSKRDGDISDFVYKWTAPDPWGPWTPVKELKAPGGFDTGKLEYAPLAHPEVRLKSGDLLVSISRNTTDLQRLFKNPEVGRPEFVQLPR